MQSIVKLSVGYTFSVIYAQGYIQALYAEYHHAKCRYAECRGAKKTAELVFTYQVTNFLQWLF